MNSQPICAERAPRVSELIDDIRFGLDKLNNTKDNLSNKLHVNMQIADVNCCDTPKRPQLGVLEELYQLRDYIRAVSSALDDLVDHI